MLVHFHRGEERARSLSDELGGAPVTQADLTVESDVDRLFDEAFNARTGGSSAVAARNQDNTASRPMRPRYVALTSYLLGANWALTCMLSTEWTCMKTRRRIS